MSAAYRSGTLGMIRHLFDAGTFAGLSDARLLERFLAHRDEAAFAALVVRHGAMVLNTCQAVLKDPAAVDDAFQATFVLLFRKGESIRGREALGGWLHRVAYRVSLQARSAAARRRDVEGAAGSLRVAESTAPDDLASVLHEEVERLPERFRLPVVLCDLEGMTREQAAGRLGWSEGAVRGRLAKGRDLLRNRLTRRGFTSLAPIAAPGAVPEGLVATAVRATTGATSDAATTLLSAAARGWALGRLRAAALTLSLLGAVAVAFVSFDPAGYQAPGDARPSRPAPRLQPPPVSEVPDSGRTTRVEGRILDLEGRPVAGATVSVKYVQSPPEGKLDAWIDEVKRLGKQSFGLAVVASAAPRPAFSATTGRDGRFRIDDMPRDGIATASVAGPGIETSEVYILTRDIPTIRVKDSQSISGQTIVYYGARFEHAAAPTRPIVGMIRDKDTGAPIPGIRITGMPNIPTSLVPTPGVEATSDAQGRYKIDGLSTTRGFKLFTEAPPGQPYVNCGFVSPAGEPKLGPFPFDMTLKRGVVVRGRLIDKATGQPLRGFVEYYAFQDNPHLDEYPNFKRETQVTRVLVLASDGRFTIPALPGRGLIAARAQEERYLHGIGRDSIKGFEERAGGFPTYPFYCSTVDKHVLAEINPEPETREIPLELQVDPGRTVEGRVLGPDGQVLEGVVEIRTLDMFQVAQQTSMNSPEFVVTGLPSGRYRLDFIHRARKLAGSLALKGDEMGKPTVTLEPWGTVVGRVVDEEGKPRIDVELFGTVRQRPDPDRGDLENRATVDAEGRFRIEGLVPGVKYDASGHSPGGLKPKADGPVLKGVQVGPGEVKDLGDITLPTSKEGEN